MDALRSIVSSYSRPLSRYFQRRLSSPQDVPDMVQEVFLRLSRIDDPAEIQKRDGFIFVTAANVLKDRARREKVRGGGGHVSSDDIDIEGSEIAPDRVLEGREAVRRLHEALMELPERTRDVFVLRMFEGQKTVDVARALGISTRAAEKHQARALAHVAERLKDWRCG